MLTAGQCIVAAFLTDGGSIICPDCAEKRLSFDWSQAFADAIEVAQEAKNNEPLSWTEENDIRDEMNARQREAEEDAGLEPLIQYSLDGDEGFQEFGCWCSDCDCVLVEPYVEENTTTCCKCGEEFPDSSMVPADDDEGGEYCVGCAPQPNEDPSDESTTEEQDEE
jgi:RNA polymerase subunit RPABC4/transcription elongation factor Spt4